ncbi:MAG: hypothetical protein ACC742_08410 [Thermoanaerobaculales bacterium]
MKALCAGETDRLIAAFECSPGQNGFFNLGAIAEVLALSVRMDATRALRDRVSLAALGWLRGGLLDDALFARVEFLYHVTLFCFLASKAGDFRPTDAAHTGRLLAGGMAGRSELPVLTMQVVATLMMACGIELDAEAFGRRDLRKVIDKRVLRARSDEFDILTLTMVGQLCSAAEQNRDRLPRLFPQALLVQAIRLGHVNWIAILALLCGTVFGMPGWLRYGAIGALGSHLEEANGLLPPPKQGFVENDHIKRVENGLRIRSSIATYGFLDA